MMMMINENKMWNDNPFEEMTEEHLLCMKYQGVCYSFGKGGGGGGQQQQQPAVTTQTTTSEFPTELQPFIEDIFGKAQAIQEQRTEEGFQSFPGPLQAGFDPAQTRAFAEIEQIPGATRGLFDEATTFAREATRSPTDPEEVATFMNPFLRNVTDIQKREAERVADVQRQQLDAKAAQSGAFGGSRAAILEAERRRNLATQLDDIEAKGLAASYQDAQTRMAAQRAREAAGATQLASLGSAIPAQQLKELGALSGVGAARQTQGQRGIDLARQEFEAEEAFPLQTLQEFQSILRGFPIAPTRTTKEQQFSAAQPLSTQLLGIGTQALGALGASGALKGAFGQEGGMVQRMPVKAYQGGGALQSLQERSRELDTSPVVGMKSGGSFMEQLLTGGLLATDKAVDTFKKLPEPVMKMLGGAALPKLLGFVGSQGQSPAPTAPTPPAPVPMSPEQLKRLREEQIRRRAQAGQQAAARGAPRAQAVGQLSQVRQPFKGGGGLRQMVKLPSNRVQFGKTAYQDVSFSEEEVETLTRPYVRDPQSSPFMNWLGGTTHDIGQEMDRRKALQKRMQEQASPMVQALEFFTGTDESLEQAQKNVAKLGESSAYLQKKSDEARGIKREKDEKKKSKDQKDENEAARKDAAKTKTPQKKKRGDELYLTPEEAGFRALMDYEGFEDKTPMVNKPMDAMSVLARNMKAGTGAVSKYMEAKEAQALLRDAAAKKQAASIAAAKTARLKNQLTMSEIKRNLDANDSAALNALAKLLDSPAVQGDPEQSQKIAEKIRWYVNKAQNNALTDVTQKGAWRYGANPEDVRQSYREREVARQVALQQAEASKKD